MNIKVGGVSYCFRELFICSSLPLLLSVVTDSALGNELNVKFPIYLGQTTRSDDFPRSTIEKLEDTIEQDEELQELKKKINEDQHKTQENSQSPDFVPSPPLPTSPSLTPEAKLTILDSVIQDSLSRSAQKYPWLVNTSDKLIIKPNAYDPRQRDTFFHIDWNFKSQVTVDSGDSSVTINNPNLNFLNFSHYFDDEQFYWVLDDNRIVIETEGIHGDTRFQGRSNEVSVTREAVSSQNLFGVQAVWSIPSTIVGLVGNERSDGTSVSSTAIQVTSPNGTVLGGISIDTGLDLNNPNVIVLDELGKGDTFSELGGGSLFDNLDADNTPGFLQGFPTVNLQGLLNGGLDLKEGAILPEENLAAVGITFGDVLTTTGAESEFEVSSTPGLRLLRPNVGSNEDLVTILSNPFLDQTEKDFHYLNSLMWFDLGQRIPDEDDLSVLEEISGDQGWYRSTISFSHNRTLLQYHPDKIQARYANIFSNPGASVTFAPFDQMNLSQTANASIGMGLGLLFLPLKANGIHKSLKEAKTQYRALQPFSRLITQSTSAQRRQMNNRFNATLRQGESNSGLVQVSGSWTFSGRSTPKRSQFLQIKTGLHERSVFFQQQDFELGAESPVFISSLRTSKEEFGPLLFRGERFPIEATGVTPLNTVIVSQTIVNLPTGETVVLNSDSRRRVATTTVPITDVKSADIAFDLIELSRTQTLTSSSNSFIGNLYFPSAEFQLSGTSGNMKYSAALGGWFNIDPNSAPGLSSNQPEVSASTTKEAPFGAYAIASLNWLFRDLLYGKDKKVKGYIVHAPFFKFDWNSAANRLNTAYLLAGYQFQYSNRKWGISATPAISYSPDGLNAIVESLDQGDLTASFYSRFFTRKGLQLTFDISLGGNTFWSTELSHTIIKRQKIGKIRLGGYWSNYNLLNRGVTSRVSDQRYGGILQYTSPRDRWYIDLRAGTSNDGFEARLQSGFKLNL